MRPTLLLRLVAFTFLVSLAASAKEPAREETLLLFQQRRVSVSVPEGFIYSSGKDERGIITAKLSDPKERITLQISFLPDTDGDIATSRGRKEFMAKTFQLYVDGSVEQAMQFEELEPRTGHGTFCVFTDASLVGKSKLPPGEFLNSTTGIKAWGGCMAVFTLLSNGTTSDEYRAAMKLLRESVYEKPTPLL